MSAVLLAPEAQFEPLTLERLDDVLRVEKQAYAHPWTETNFRDTIKTGYQAQLLTAAGEVLGYFVAMKGVEEVHLLNITVAPSYQRQGWARLMLEALTIWARGDGALWLWLEVRVGNLRAMRVYEQHGFRRVGLRKAYYPAGFGKREDAVVMSLHL
ncbi:MAG: ribosomal protein S18-alanine N-acetyltransferase [Betaproteobacteria bacterium]